MSEQPQPFTIEDVEAAWFAYKVDQCLAEGQPPEHYIRWNWREPPEGTYEILGIAPQQPILLALYQKGAEILTRAEVVSSRRITGREIAASDYEQLGKVDSPIWIDDNGQTIHRNLRALRFRSQ